MSRELLLSQAGWTYDNRSVAGTGCKKKGRGGRHARR
jgi:hypothetical protein